MEFTAKQIADFVGGRVEGDINASVHTFAKIEEGTEGAISFLSNPKYTHYLYDTKSSVVLINEDVKLERSVKATLIRVKDTYECIAKLLQLYESSKPRKTGVHSLACISPKALIGKDCYIGPFVYIGDNVRIGDGCQIYPNSVIEDNVSFGDNCLIYANVSIPAPPYSSGKGIPISPISAIILTFFIGNSSVLSISAAKGFTSFTAKSCTISNIS